MNDEDNNAVGILHTCRRHNSHPTVQQLGIAFFDGFTSLNNFNPFLALPLCAGLYRRADR